MSFILLIVLGLSYSPSPVNASIQSPPEDWWVDGWVHVHTDLDQCGTDDFRDVYKIWLKYDANYLYIKVSTIEKPGWDGPDYRNARYSWYFDVDGSTDPAWIDGNNVRDTEYKLFLEDFPKCTDVKGNGMGELYLIKDMDGSGEYSDWEITQKNNYRNNAISIWPGFKQSYNTLGPLVPNAQDEPQRSNLGDIDSVGFRIEGYYVHMYVSWESIGITLGLYDFNDLSLFCATDSEEINLNSAENLDNPKTGLSIEFAVIYGTVFNDANGSGVRDLGELGISGVNMSLWNGSGLIVSETTNTCGAFSFPVFQPGVYSVVEADLFGWRSTTPNEVHVPVELGNAYRVDFGDTQNASTASIFGIAFLDDNGNGIMDAEEIGIPGVNVTLGQGLANVITNPYGAYNFATFQSGPQNVTADLVEGMFRTTPGTIFFDVELNESVCVNFGYAPVNSSFGVAYGTVFHDLDHDGNRDMGELAIPGVQVSLYNETGLIYSVTTSSCGVYTLKVSENGNYTIIETDPAEYVSTTSNRINTTLVIGSSNDSPYDFGDFEGAVIYGVVFDDLNVNGVNEGEPPLAGAYVKGVYNNESNSDSFGPTTGSLVGHGDWTGNYILYVNSGEGVYHVVETDPTGYVSTNAIPGTNVSRISANEVKVNVTYGNYYKADFGDVLNSTVGQVWGVVFHDMDGDGFQDPDEPGVPGVIVRVSTGMSQTTSSDGEYLLYSLPETYIQVFEEDPPGWVSTTPNTVTAYTYTVPNGSVVNFGDRPPIEIKKYTNGVDADSPPGPPILVNRTVIWTYNIKNIGSVTLTNIVLVDDQLGDITYLLPKRELAPGESMIITVVDTAAPGQYNNTAAVNAAAHFNTTIYDMNTGEWVNVTIDTTFSDSDVSHYYGVQESEAVIYGLVFNDNGSGGGILANGIRDGSEPVIPGVNVTLHLGGELVNWQLTDVDGNFFMLVTQPGVYTVTEINLPGYVSTNAIPDPGVKIDNDNCNFTVELGHIYAAIFGDVQSNAAAVIMGCVFNDENEDGVFNATTEHGIPNVNVTLEIEDGNVINVMTDPGGAYQFAVQPGTDVRITSEGPSDPAWYPTTPESMFARPPTAGIYPGYNFGYSNDSDVAVIYGIVFYDMNSNGERELGELGLELVNANVSLYKDGELLATTMTPGNELLNGTFAFAVNETGAYRVNEQNPPGWRSTTPDDINVNVFELGRSYLIEFGDTNRTDISTIYGIVFNDFNGNGKQDPDEHGIKGVNVTLWHGDELVANYTTLSYGHYSFGTNIPGIYYVKEFDLLGWHSTTPNTVTIYVELHNSYVVNFGDSNRSDVSSVFGAVFDDRNVDGAWDRTTEPSIEDVTVTLYNSTSLIGICTTNEWGQYAFQVSQLGIYTVVETDPPGYVSTIAIPGDPGATWVSNNELGVNVTSLGVDFGDNLFGDVLASEVGQIEGVVFHDKNGDGFQDLDEPGIPGSVVTLSSGMAQTTGTDGSYLLYAPTGRNVNVTEYDPPGWVSTTPNTVEVYVEFNLSTFIYEVNFGDNYPMKLQKYTNGVDADSAPGPYILIDDTVTWTYNITNIGYVNLTNIVLVDDQLGDITYLLPKRELAPGESMIIKVYGTAAPGQYNNTATINAAAHFNATIYDMNTGERVNVTIDTIFSDSDMSHYYGVNASVSVEKFTNGVDAVSAPGPYILVGDTVAWTYNITNTGNVNLTGIVLVDDEIGDVTLPKTSLEPGEWIVGSASGTAVAGEYNNTATVTAMPPGGLPDVTDSDTNYYYGFSASIDGIVFNDKDGDGEWDSGELGISGVNVTLYRGGDLVVNDTTGSFGEYSFAITDLGYYTVIETDLPEWGWFSTTPNEVHVQVEFGNFYQVNFGDAFDQTSPVIVSVTNDPEPPLEHGESTEVSVEASDNFGVVYVEIEWPGSRLQEMVYNEVSSLWKYIIPGQDAGTNFSVTVRTYDPAGNYGEYTFNKWWTDQTDPVIVSVVQSNDAPFVGEDVEITVHITDNVGVDHVTISYDNVDYVMMLNSGNTANGYWIYTIPGPITETTITYNITAYDSTDNEANHGPHEIRWILRNPNITLWPTEGYGSTTVYGEGFEPNSVITLTCDGASITTAPLIITTDDGGEFTAIINIMSLETTPGTYSVKAIDELGNWAVAFYTVLEAPEGEPGQAGDSGQDISLGYLVGMLLVVMTISLLVSLSISWRGRRREGGSEPQLAA